NLWTVLVAAGAAAAVVLLYRFKWLPYVGGAMHRDQYLSYYWTSGVQHLPGDAGTRPGTQRHPPFPTFPVDHGHGVRGPVRPRGHRQVVFWAGVGKTPKSRLKGNWRSIRSNSPADKRTAGLRPRCPRRRVGPRLLVPRRV